MLEQNFRVDRYSVILHWWLPLLRRTFSSRQFWSQHVWATPCTEPNDCKAPWAEPGGSFLFASTRWNADYPLDPQTNLLLKPDAARFPSKRTTTHFRSTIGEILHEQVEISNADIGPRFELARLAISIRFAI